VERKGEERLETDAREEGLMREAREEGMKSEAQTMPCTKQQRPYIRGIAPESTSVGRLSSSTVIASPVSGSCQIRMRVCVRQVRKVAS
jgi:hypothetical protein